MLLFREALVSVKTAFAEEPSFPRVFLDRAAQRVAQAEQNSVTPTSPSSALMMSMSAPTLKAAVPTSSSLDMDTVLFSHPFAIHAPCRREDTDECYYFCSNVDIDSSLFSAVIIYNMAVTTHKMSQLEPAGRRRDVLRQRTSSLYDMCHQLLNNTSEQVNGASRSSSSGVVQVTGTGRAMFDLMCMAIVNNKAELYLETADHQLSLVHMEQLAELASSVRQQRYGDETLNTAVQTAVQFFLSNAHHTRICAFCAAPAA